MGYALNPFCKTTAQRFVCLLCIAGMLLLPATPALALFDFTIADEAELGRKFEILVKSKMPIIQDPEVTTYIDGLVQQLNKAVPPQAFPFKPSVLRSNSVNAFAVPGGNIFICTGLIAAMEHEAEVVGVLAHEMAHVTQRHIASRIQQSTYISILSVLGALAGALLGGEAGSAMIGGSMAAQQAALLHYSRANETDADQVGFGYLVKAGFPPIGIVGAFKILSRKQWIMGGNIPSYYSTHPDINSRVKYMQAQVDALPQAIKNKPHNDAQFLRIQTLIRARYSDPDFAAVTFTKELQKRKNFMSYLGQGILFARQNKIAPAREAFEKALTLAPNDYLVAREAGYFHYVKADRTKGLHLLNKAISLNRNDIIALFYLSRALADQGDYQTALNHLQNVLRRVPEDIEVHETIADIHGKNNNLFQAYLHLAYSTLYANNERKTRTWVEKLASLAKTPEQNAALERFNKEYKQRQEFW